MSPDPVVLFGVYLLGVATIPVVVIAWLAASGPAKSTEEIEGRPYAPAVFVSRTSGEEFSHISEAKAHALNEQGWVSDGPEDDSWRQGFTVRPSDTEMDA